MKRYFYDSYGLRPWAFAVALILGVAIFICAIAWFQLEMNKHDCEVYSRVTGYPTQYQFGTCYTFIDGEWMAGKPTIIKGVN